MGWVDVDEPFAAPPRNPGPLTAPGDDGVIDLDDRRATIRDAVVAGTVDVRGCDRVEIDGSVLRGVRFVPGPATELVVRSGEIADTDLSGLRLTALTDVIVRGCKLAGTDLTSAPVRDVVLVDCVLAMASVRMAELERVAFTDCTLDRVDFYDAALADVSFAGCRLRGVDVDRVSFHRVDLRGAIELDLRSVAGLSGCLVAPEQVPGLAWVLARAAGVGVERPPDQQI